LGAGSAHLRAFDTTVLFDLAMIGFHRPGVIGKPDTGEGFHVQVVGGPVFFVIVWSDDQEQANEAIALEMNDPTVRVGFALGDQAATGSVGIDSTVGFQTGQLRPLPISNLLEVF